MTTREAIIAEVEAVPEQELDDLLRVVRRFAHRSTSDSADKATNGVATQDKETIFDKLSKFKIHAPRDFSENFELYASGEKRFDDDPGLH